MTKRMVVGFWPIGCKDHPEKGCCSNLGHKAWRRQIPQNPVEKVLVLLFVRKRQKVNKWQQGPEFIRSHKHSLTNSASLAGVSLSGRQRAGKV